MYLSSFVEIVIFLSDAVARQHRIVLADLCIFAFSIISKHKAYITQLI